MDQQQLREQLIQAQTLLREGELAEAETAFRTICAQDIPDGWRALALDGLGVCLRSDSRYDEAEDCCHAEIALLEGLFGAEHPHLVSPLENLALLLAERGQFAEALEPAQTALSILRAHCPDDKGRIADALINVSSHQYNLGDYDSAEGNLKLALKLWEGVAGRRSMGVSTCLNNLGRICENRGHSAEGVRYHAEAADIRQEVLGENTETAFSLGNYGVALAGDGQWDKAAQALEQCVAMYERLGKGQAAHVCAYRDNLAVCRRAAQNAGH